MRKPDDKKSKAVPLTSDDKKELIINVNELIICAVTSNHTTERAASPIIHILNYVNDLIKVDLDPLR